jgi:peptidoglycan/xylan/chitin deacetylase (PgdA/CDA1 family)
VKLLSLDFDDGFARSCERAAAIFEGHGLRAGFNVLADPDGFLDDNPGYPDHGRGSWELWNALQLRGHAVNPHGWDHHNLGKLPHDEAVASIGRCLEAFERGLHGFERRRSLYAFAYDSASPALEAWMPDVVRGYRVWGTGINPLPTADLTRITTSSWGPDDVDGMLERAVEAFLAGPDAWMLCGLHGLDGEGWGPVEGRRLDALLGQLVKVKDLKILPGSQALLSAAA